MIRPLLALDTSTEAMAIALDGPAGTATALGPGGAQASARLLPQVQAMLAAQGLATRELAAIAFGAGPGAFTGLRTACAVAQGLALGARVPVAPLDSLMIVAEDARCQCRDAGDVGVVMDARMGEVYAARYLWDGADWGITMAPALFDPVALSERWLGAPPTLIAGNGAAMLDHRLAPPDRVVATESDRAAALLVLAHRAVRAGRTVDPAAALPLYLRDKVAQTTAERLAQAGARPGAALR